MIRYIWYFALEHPFYTNSSHPAEAIEYYWQSLWRSGKNPVPDFLDGSQWHVYSWAIVAGETSEWVARMLEYVDNSIMYKTYGRYIPNLTRQDGSAFEKQYRQATNEEKQPK